MPHCTTGRALTHHVVEFPECVPDQLLAFFGDAVRHRQLPHRSPLQGMRRTPTDEAIPNVAIADDEALADGPLSRLAQEVHEVVKRQVAPQTWNAFWSIAVEELTIRETATALNLSYAAAFAAHKRVVARLRAAGERLLSERENGRVDTGASEGNGGGRPVLMKGDS